MRQARKASTREKGLSPRWQKAAIAAFQAGGIAALNARSQSGAWKGEKGARVATAALGAATLDAFGTGREGKESVPKDDKAEKVKAVEDLGGALGGMLAERLASKSGSGRRGERD
ncbi:hypothetical protein GE09DRAFT_1063166 [Coniochaeta sp. 2T2.1]|nr:hypothetical protein GE09DRAFT_1063166 [Coniochaeta sp. 2T2.1]